MSTERLDVRLDQERWRKLCALAKSHGTSISETVRKLIDDEYETDLTQRRLAAALRLGTREIGEALEPDELNKLLEEAHDVPDLH